MKKQSKMDRLHESVGERHKVPLMHEDHGSHKHHLMAEHHRHGERIHHEAAMHHRKKSHFEHSSAPYEHEVDEPKLPPEGHLMPGFGAEDFKDEADPIAYGQAAKEGMRSDMHKIHAQFKEYHWD